MRFLPALLILCALLPAATVAAPDTATLGTAGFQAIKRCVMENDASFCRNQITPESYSLFDRFVSYKLMPCLPTDFSYQDEAQTGQQTVVKASMPAGGGQYYILRMVFADTPSGPKLDLPESLRRGMGDKWENKIQLSEQLYLMMRQNMGDKLNCDMLTGLIKQH